jgi:hypothetical protein
MTFDYLALLDALVDGEVEFIVVGGVAAACHGAARATYDIDVVYERSDANLAKIVRALRPHAPYLRGAPPGLPFIFDERTLRNGLNFTFSTTRGDLDLLGEVTGGGGYAALVAHSTTAEIHGRSCRVVDLDTLIHLKRAAGRVKDLEAIAELELIRDELALHKP